MQDRKVTVDFCKDKRVEIGVLDEEEYCIPVKGKRIEPQTAEKVRGRLIKNGFVILRDFHEREQVLSVRKEMIEGLQKRGLADETGSVISSSPELQITSSAFFNIDRPQSLIDLVNGTLSCQKLSAILDCPPSQLFTFGMQWVRCVATGGFSTPHMDRVFMSNGSTNVVSLWTPLGDYDPADGPLAFLIGSHKNDHLLNKYATHDVDRDLITGEITEHPMELEFAGKWMSTTYRAGDVALINQFIVHSSTTNTSKKFRLSCDTRYQRQDEVIDERWREKIPIGNAKYVAARSEGRLEDINVSKKRWGLG